MTDIPRASNKNNGSSWVSVYSGRDCIGHVLSRGSQGFEALDANDQSLGLFDSQQAAAHALAGPST
jgi:hypothetical protein